MPTRPPRPGAHLSVRTLSLMLPTLVTEVPRGGGWLFEIKWDGVRVLALRTRGQVALHSRTGRLVTAQYPEVAAAVAALPGGDLALDGEIVAPDAAGRPTFHALQRRMHATRDVAALAAASPVSVQLYDCLVRGGRDLRDLPLTERKRRLRALLPAHGPLRCADHFTGDGVAFFEEACAAGLEGVVAKRADAPYRGGRTLDWRKIKCQQRQEFVIGGWTDPRGTRSRLGAVHLGVYEDGALVYVGRAGSGLDETTLGALHARLRGLGATRCPFARGDPPRGPGHHWVRPALVCEVRFSEWTPDGQLRHPVFLGLRADRRPRDVRREVGLTPRS